MSKKYKIAIPEFPIEREDLPAKILEECELFDGEKGVRGDNAQLMKHINEVDAIIFNSSNSITAELMQMAPNLKIAFKSGARPENIDYDYAKNNGIAVGWTPAANAQSVAEYTVLLMMSVQKKLMHAADSLKKGGWRDQSHIGRDICGETVGIVGLGGIGRRVAAMLNVIGAKVVAFDPYTPDEVFEKENVERVSFGELLSVSDIVSIHCMLTDDTRKMFNAEAFAKMKPTAVLINSARGGMIDEEALYNALSTGQIAFAALDVYYEEPPAMDNPLRKLDNILMTPHVAARTKEAAYRECVWAIQGSLDYLHGREIKNAAVIAPDAEK